MLGNGNSFALEEYENPRIPIGFLYRFTGGLNMIRPPLR